MLFVFLFLFAGLSAFAQTLSLISGNGLIVQESFPAPKPFRVRATSTSGAGVPDLPITWTIKQGEGQLTNVVNRTDSNGFATAEFFGSRLLQGDSYKTAIINASSSFGSVDFVASTVATRSIGGNFVGLPQIELIQPTATFNGPPGTVYPKAFGVRVIAQAGLGIGQGIPNVGLRTADPVDPEAPYARCAGVANTALTDTNGNAYCDLVLANNPGFGFVTVTIGDISEFIRAIPITITAGAACTFNVAPTAQGAAFTGATGTVSVTVASGQSCSWVASSNTPWISITSGAIGQNNGTVSYLVAPNTGAARTGTISVAGKTVTVNQAAQGSSGPGTITFVSTSPLPAGIVSVPYSLQLTTSGGVAPLQWSAGGTFPPGLGLAPTTGLVTGTPTTAGTFSFTLTVVDSTGASVSAPFTATISPSDSATTVTIITASLQNGIVGTQYQQSITAIGACNANPFGGGALTWQLASGALPAGLTLLPSGSSAAITGTPTAAGTFNFAVRATDSCSRSDTKNLTLTITGTPAQQNTMAAAPSNIEFSVAYTAASSSQQTVALSTVSDSLQYTAATTTPWLSVTPGNGTTPANITVQAVDIAGFAPGVYNGSVSVTSAAANSPISIPVTLRVASPVNIIPAPESFTFRQTAASPVSQQTLTVGGVSPGIRFFLTTEVAGGSQWLTVNPTSGETTAAVQVRVDTTGLQPGTYSGVVRVIPDGNAGGTRLVPVTAIVAPSTAIVVDQTPLAFTGTGTKSLLIGATGGNMGFTVAAANAPWLSVTPASGNAPATVSISANSNGLNVGTYQGSIVVTPASGQAVTVPVTLTITQGQPVIASVTNAASFAPGPVAPGELVTLFGADLGPASLVSGDFDASGALQTSVSNVRVLFDNVAAPIIHVSAGQISAVVPFGVFGRPSAKVQVVNNGQMSNIVDVQIADAMPGIFVIDVNGQGAILNQDGSVNARLNGAAPGSIVAIYANGGGQMDRQVFDGRRVMDAPFPKPLLPVGVRIGGRVADVTYAGAAPGLVAGVIQVNAKIPEDTPRGTVVPVQIIIGTATSQANVMLATAP